MAPVRGALSARSEGPMPFFRSKRHRDNEGHQPRPQRRPQQASQKTGRDTLVLAAEIIGRRLSPADLRRALKEIDNPRRGEKGVQWIVAEAEDRGGLFRSRIDDAELPRFVLDVAGFDLLASRRVRYVLALRATDDEQDRLNDFPGASRARGTSAEAIARCVSERNWHPGKRWARHFVSVLGFPTALAGIAGTPAGPDFEDVDPHVPLDPLADFQSDLRSQVFDLLHAGPGQNRAVLTLPTGAGKTRTTVEALLDWWLVEGEGDFILWVAQSDELCEQAVQAFKEVWIDRGSRAGEPRVRDKLRVYRFWGGRQRIPQDGEAGIVISTVDKLRKVLVDPEDRRRRDAFLDLARTLGAIVIDEAHRAEAPTYRKVLEAIGIDFSAAGKTAIPVLGLTATPLRSQHEETLRLARRFYNRLLRPQTLPQDPIDAVAALRARGVLARPVHRVLPPSHKAMRLTIEQERYLEEWKDLPPDVLTQLAQERNRNRQIVEAIVGIDPAWPVLFFGCSVHHAEAMVALLRRRDRAAAVITADTRETTRRHLVQAFRQGEIKVLCNYGVLTTGFDAPTVRAVVVGRPTTSRVLYEQMIGRGMRGPAFGGTPECLVIDVDDNLVHVDGQRLSTAALQYTDYWSRTDP
jgi:DNA repair protein RadD